MVKLNTPQINLNLIATDFNLLGVDGKYHSLKEIGDKPFIVMFICNHCPFVKRIINDLSLEIKKIKDDYKVNTFAIMPNDVEAYPDDSHEEMKKFSTNHGLCFPYLIDEKQDIAKAYGAVCTPDIFIFNSSKKLRYRGRFDNINDIKYKFVEGKSELYNAVKKIIENEDVDLSNDVVHGIGCSIKWKDKNI
ncbi:MAG: thioredoxin family protein [Anaplasmataceae bacterium]|nr:thioredoxin family protein [Anaplasmataceae bacterium]